MRGDVYRFSPRIDDPFLFWEALKSTFGGNESKMQKLLPHVSIVIFDTEQVYLKQKINNFKISELTKSLNLKTKKIIHTRKILNPKP